MASTAPPALDLADPAWLAHRYDRDRDAIGFRYVPRVQHSEGAFLTDEYLGPATDLRFVPRAEAVAAAPAGPMHMIAHSAFCNSTLLVRALDAPGVAMGLSEPVILNDIVGVRRRREAEMRDVAALLDGAMQLLARPWRGDAAVIVKPSNILNPLMSGMMALRPDMQITLLYAPVETFIASVARKGMWCRLWVRELLEGLLIDGVVDLGFSERDYFRQTDLQVAAVAWLAQHALFQAMIARYGPQRVRALPSEVMMADPAAAIARIGTHYQLAIDADRAHAIANGRAFAQNSKDGRAFSMEQRRADQASALAAHGDEIAKVSEWAAAVGAAAGIAMVLPASLLD